MNCCKRKNAEASQNKTSSKVSFRDLCHSRKMALICVIMCLVWFVDILIVNALSLGTALLPGDRYLNFFISGLTEVPSLIIVHICLQRLGRRLTLFLAHFASAVGLLALVPVILTNSPQIAITAIAFFSKFAILMSFDTMLLYATEIYPTNLRNFGVGLSGVCGRLGNVIAPQFVYLARTNTWIPYLIFGICAALIAFFGLYLPEPQGRELPTSVEEIEHWTHSIAQRGHIDRLVSKTKFSVFIVCPVADEIDPKLFTGARGN